jgi:hypothetical protein
MAKKIKDKLEQIDLTINKLEQLKLRNIEKALKSDDPTDLIRAQSDLFKMQGVAQKQKQFDQKAFFIDPLQFNANLGYKDKPYSLSYLTLKRMSKTPIINSILKTRKNQVADFAEPQENKYSTGFVIRKKPKFGQEQKMTKHDRKIAVFIQDFLLKGSRSDNWNNDDFDTFIRKIVEDSLIYDQMTFECIRKRNGELDSFRATDGATFRIADSYFAKDYLNPSFDKFGAFVNMNKNRTDWGEQIKGYWPTHVQVYQTNIVSHFYPWELCFASRNPSTSIWNAGYGVSELEELINVVTSLLWGDEYNRRFFSQGSAPKGLLRVKGNVNETALQQFKQQWQAMITGVMQSWKTPVVEADIDWVDLQKNNRDMEYSSWMEYLIKLCCGVYNIDPIEIGWDISRGSGDSLFGKSEKERLRHSKDKGLYPLLKFLQRKINKYIVDQLHPDFEFVFMGLNGLSISEELDMDVKKTNSFVTLNETREKYELPPVEGGDIVLNPTYVQAKNAAAMQAQQNQQGAGEDNYNSEETDEDFDWDSFVNTAEGDEDQEDETQEMEGTEKGMNKTFRKAFDNFFKTNK